MQPEDTARYRGFLLAPAEGFGLRFFRPSEKKRAFYAVYLFLDYSICSVVTSVTFSSNLSNFKTILKKHPKYPKKINYFLKSKKKT